MITVFKNVTVITPWEQKDAVVVVKDGVIAGVHSRCDILEGAEVIDGGGRFLSSPCPGRAQLYSSAGTVGRDSHDGCCPGD